MTTPSARGPDLLAAVFARNRDDLAASVAMVRSCVEGAAAVRSSDGSAAAHRLVGSLGTLGFADASAAAARLEDDFRTDGGRPAAEQQADLAVIDRVFGPAPIAYRSAAPTETPVLDPGSSGGRILVVDDDPVILQTFAPALTAAGFAVVTASTGREALRVLERMPADLIVSDVNMPDMGGFELIRELRHDPRTIATPLVFATTRGSRDDIVAGLGLGADDYLVKPVDPVELVARVRARLARTGVASLAAAPEAVPKRGAVRSDALVKPASMRRVLDREIDRVARGARSGAAARVELIEIADLRHRLGPRAIDVVLAEVRKLVRAFLRPADVGNVERDGVVTLFIADVDADQAESHVRAISQAVAVRRFPSGGDTVRLTPAIGWIDLDGTAGTSEVLDRIEVAAAFAAARLDLQPERWHAGLEPGAVVRKPRIAIGDRIRTPFQILLTLVVGLVIPFETYRLLADAGHDITPVMYLVVVVSLALTGALILVEGVLALKATYPPGDPPTEYPRATAIIAAYLPNEAPTLIETLDAFRDIDYPDLKVIVAYNTTTPLPIEAELRELERRWPDLLVLRVEGSTSKAQNVNAAMSHVEGEMVAMFDADHHPDRHAFRRAWQWLSNGYDVVQGHCVVRNGSASRTARTVAVEFEAIYAVSHPGRARMHDFGVFGGSNGYWRAGLLRKTRMQGRMLTEDIDSSLRVVERGHRIASDRTITSRELATTTMNALWNQRMRWAQGWFQVALRHTSAMFRPSSALNFRQRLGYLHLLVWREVYPWLTLQMFPIIAYWLFVDRPIDWKVPIFVMTTVFTLSVGPVSTLFAYKLADAEVKAHRWWFLWYLVIASLVYTEYKNTIARVAHIKEAMGDRKWVVTPRTTGSGSAGSAGPPD